MSAILQRFKNGEPPSRLAFDVETTGLDRSAEILTLAVGWVNDDGSIESESFFLDRYSKDLAEVEAQEAIVQEILECSLFNPEFQGLALFHNLNFDVPLIIKRFRPVMRRVRSVDFCPLADTAAISRIFRNNAQSSHVDAKGRRAHSLKFLVEALSQLTDTDPTGNGIRSYDEVVQGIALRWADRRAVEEYNRQDTELTLKIYSMLLQLMTPEERTYVEEIENPHSFNLLHLAFHGVPYDRPEADRIFEAIEQELVLLEGKFSRLVGRAVKLESLQDLAHALFFNPRLTFKSNGGDPESLRPLYLTDNDQAKVDLDTLNSIYRNIEQADPSSPILSAVSIAMRHIELSKSRSSLERLDYYGRRDASGYRIYPNISANAASGRVTCSRPNLLGIPKKILRKSKDLGIDFHALGLDSASTALLQGATVRQVVRTPAGCKIGAIDINGLDLVVLAEGAIAASGNQKFYWLNFINQQFGETIDSHFALLQRFNSTLYKNTFAKLLDTPGLDPLDFWAKKPSKESGQKGIWFIHKQSGERQFVPFPSDGGGTEQAIEGIRELSKKLNFATSYLVGSLSFAVKLREALRAEVSSIEAEKNLRDFYACFPEIRVFQDQVANLVYHKGYVQCPFGRRFYADVWDKLNAYYQAVQVKGGDDSYELIVRGGGKYWYIRAHGWIKDGDNVIEDLRLIPKPFGLQFRSISILMEMPSWIFNEADPEERRRIEFHRKSEDSTEDVGEFALSRVAITDRIERHLNLGVSLSAEGQATLSNLVHEGGYLIPENRILFYRVGLNDPASRYFRRYKSLLRVAKKFFPNYCQGVAATIAKKTLTHARRRIERESDFAVILFFIHDQIDVMFREGEERLIQEILEESVGIDMSPFPLRFSGHYEEKGRSFR